MSTLATNAITDASGGNTATINSFTPTVSNMAGRNRIINGDMRIAQRGTSAVTAGGSYPVDRFYLGNNTDGAFSAQQDSSAPAGFVNSVKVTTTTADGTLTTTQVLQLRQGIEGTNIADLGWGSANAKTVTLSFWVRSSLTGSFGGSLRNSGSTRSYPFLYTISVADTWEYKTVTILGDTSGTWLTTNDIGIQVIFGLGAGPDRSGPADTWASTNYISATGAVSVIGTLNATWYITGVQLEAGSVATPFERRQYGQELALCQRYFISYGGSASYERFGTCLCSATTGAIAMMPFPVEMRATPTFGYASLGSLSIYTGTAVIVVTAVSGDNPSPKVGMLGLAVASGLTAGATYQFLANNTTSARATWSAEL